MISILKVRHITTLIALKENCVVDNNQKFEHKLLLCVDTRYGTIGICNVTKRHTHPRSGFVCTSLELESVMVANYI